MNILIAYATNSGSTKHTAELIQDKLAEANKNTTVLPAQHTTPEQVKSADLVLFGTNSWLVNEEQGQPHETMTELLEKLDESILKNKNCVVFGCGDDSYIKFCGAVDIVENELKAKGAKTMMPALKVNSFYFDLDKNIEMVEAWAQVLSEQI